MSISYYTLKYSAIIKAEIMKEKWMFLIIICLIISSNVILASTDKGTLLSAGISKDATKKADGVAQLFDDLRFILEYNEAKKVTDEYYEGVYDGYPLGQSYIKLGWYNSGKEDRLLINSPIFSKYDLNTPSPYGPNTIEDPYHESPSARGIDAGFIEGAESIKEVDRKKAYITGYFDTNGDHTLDGEEVLNAIEEWYIDKFDLYTLVEVLNLWSSSITIESVNDSDVPSVSLNADPSPSPCGNEIKVTAVTRVFGIAPLRDADISMTAITASSPLGKTDKMFGKTDNKGTFTWIYTPPRSSGSCGGSITFTARVTKNGKSATTTLPVVILSTITPKINMQVQTIQIPSDQSSKDQLKDQLKDLLHSQIVSGIEMTYVIQPSGKKIVPPDTNFESYIVNGISSICALGVPGPLEATDSKAAPLVTGDSSTSPPFAVVSMLSSYGKGRIVALGHDGFFLNEAIDLYDNGKFGNNIIDWLDEGTKKKMVLVTTGHSEWWVATDRYDKFFDNLEARGYQVSRFSGVITPSELSNVNVLLINSAWDEFSDSEIDAINNYVSNGGGLFVWGLGWSWVKYKGPIDDYPMNKLGKQFGIRWIDGYIEDSDNNYQGQPIFHTFK
jgi:hypothetical protein